ncbi:glycosyl hydrolase family 17 protein [Zavarzinia compransoris]|nr:glycosyl hydrolase family 17 protein [Zavarzinia compransoris]
MMHRSVLKPAAVALLALLLTFAAWWWPNRPVALPNPYDGVIESVSFAPFRGTQSPLTGNFPSEADIATALDALIGKAAGVRTYTALEGMQAVPELAKARGLKVFAGAWLGPLPRVNQNEIASLIDLANRFPGTIERVLVGNEVLLRKDLPVEKLIEHIRTVKAAVKQPVTYADVWEFWLRNPQLAGEVDFITIHILPYWEDFPLPVEVGNGHVAHILDEVRKAFPDKPVVIGEIGWPSHGRDREKAVPGRVQLATFITNFLNKARAEGIRYNVIEAFDQPWKSGQEGTVGANWGLFDENWQPKFDLSGPVVELPQWKLGFAAGALLILVVTAMRRERIAGYSPARLIAGGALLALAAYAGSRAGLEAWLFAYMPGPELWAAVKAAIAIGLALTFAATCFRLLSDDPRLPAGGWTVVGGQLLLLLATVLGFALGLLLVVGVTDDILVPILPQGTVSLLWPLLPVDGRYRDFPTVYVGLAALAPLVVALLAAWTGRDRFLDRLAFGRVFGTVRAGRPKGRGWVAGLAAAGFVAQAVALIAIETPDNVEAWYWAACLALFALPLAASVRRQWIE